MQKIFNIFIAISKILCMDSTLTSTTELDLCYNSKVYNRPAENGSWRSISGKEAMMTAKASALSRGLPKALWHPGIYSPSLLIVCNSERLSPLYTKDSRSSLGRNFDCGCD